MKRTIGVTLCGCLILSAALAQTTTPKPGSGARPPVPAKAAAGMKLPTKDEVNAAMKRTLGYDPLLTWEIYDIRASVIPGVADLLLSINKQAAQHIYMSASTQNAVVGEMIPFGPDPFVPIRAKLQAVDGPAQGSQTPAILLVEFSDLECPHCKAAQPIIEKLTAEFPQVRYVFQQFPLPASLHPWAMKAAEYSDCAGQLNPSAFWKYLDSVFENQGSIAEATAEEQLKGLAGTAGLDAEKLSMCAGLPRTEARVKKSLELGESLNVNQTPTIFINGRRVLGIADTKYDQLKALVQFEIDHAGK